MSGFNIVRDSNHEGRIEKSTASAGRGQQQAQEEASSKREKKTKITILQNQAMSN